MLGLGILAILHGTTLVLESWYPSEVLLGAGAIVVGSILLTPAFGGTDAALREVGLYGGRSGTAGGTRGRGYPDDPSWARRTASKYGTITALAASHSRTSWSSTPRRYRVAAGPKPDWPCRGLSGYSRVPIAARSS